MNDANAFWAKVRKTETGCWEWKGAHLSSGYPFVEWHGSRTTATRVAYELEYGAIPAKGFIRPSCNNRNCVNPNHLYAAPGNFKTKPEVARRNAMVRFWRSVQKCEGDGCWLWTGYTINGGYGIISVCGKGIGAHRFSYELNVGPLEKGKMICHKCDNPLCVRPDHLFQGTARDNVIDMHIKGRAKKHFGDDNWMRKHKDLVPRGEDHQRAVLTNEEAKLARVMFATGATQLEIAGEFRVDNTTISNIVKNKTYNTPSAQPEELHKIVFRGKSSVLSEEDQENLVSQYRNGERRSELAKIFNLSFPSVCRIITKITGEQPKKRIAEETVLAIRAMKKAGRPLKEIASTHKVSLTTASNICTGKAWSGVLNASDPTESLRTPPCSTA